MKLNGKVARRIGRAGQLSLLHRTWKTGDRIEMDLPMHLHAEAMPDDPQVQAFLYGPLVLAGDLGVEGITEAAFQGTTDIRIPALRAASADPASWIKPSDKPLTFQTTGQKQNVTLVPLNSLFNRRYTVYWQVS